MFRDFFAQSQGTSEDTDLNCLSIMQYAIDALRIGHLMVCGHYGRGGVRSAARGHQLGLIDNWLRHVQDVAQRHRALLAEFPEEEQVDRLCELNVEIDGPDKVEPSYRAALEGIRSGG